MRFQFTHPWLLVALPLAVAWMVWLWVKSDVQVSAWRRWCSLGLRLLVTVAVCLALAGLQWLRPQEGLNVFYLLDRSDSIPSVQQEQARELVNQLAQPRKATDRGGVVVFGSEASIETMPNAVVDLKKVQAVIGTGRSDLAAGIQLGTAAFPETGQKRLVLMSDGNENLGDALASVLSARSLGVTLDVVPLGVARGGDVAVQKVSVPAKLKKGQTFDAKIFVQSDTARAATVRLFRNDQSMGETVVNLQAGKNLFTFPQTLNDSGFYSYDVRIESEGDQLPQNNRGSAFATVQGDPRVLVVSSDPAQDADLAAALRTTRLDVKLVGPSGFPGSLAEMQSYESIFLCNLEASIMGSEGMGQLESAVRDFRGSASSASAATSPLLPAATATPRSTPLCRSAWNSTAKKSCRPARWCS
jgi:Ca-activated chloride channel family protein